MARPQGPAAGPVYRRFAAEREALYARRGPVHQFTGGTTVEALGEAADALNRWDEEHYETAGGPGLTPLPDLPEFPCPDGCPCGSGLSDPVAGCEAAMRVAGPFVGG